MTVSCCCTVLIRDAKPDEIDAVIAVGLVAYQEYSNMMPPDAWDAYADNIRDAHSRLPESKLIVAEIGNILVGAVTYYPIDMDRINVVWPPDWAGIRLVAVKPESRGRGIGRLLVEECIRRSRDQSAAAVGLHTTPLMQLAERMYRRIGFVRAPDYDFQSRPNFDVTAYMFDLK